MFILNTQAHARLDQMAQQFEVVCNGLNENEGQAYSNNGSICLVNSFKLNSS